MKKAVQYKSTTEKAQAIKEGTVQVVCVGSISMKENLSEIYQKLSVSPISIANYVDPFSNERVLRLKDEYLGWIHKHFAKTDWQKRENQPCEQIDQSRESINLELWADDKGLGIAIRNPVVDAIGNHIRNVVDRYNFLSDISLFASQDFNLFVLPPVFSGKNRSDIIFGDLLVFSNKQFILTCTKEVANQAVDRASQSGLSFPVSDALVPLCAVEEHKHVVGYYERQADVSVDDIVGLYLDGLHNALNCTFSVLTHHWKILYLWDFTSQPKSFEIGAKSNDYKEDMMKLLQAPMPPFNLPPKDILEKRLNAACYNFNKSLEMYVSTIPRIIASTSKENLGYEYLVNGLSDGKHSKEEVISTATNRYHQDVIAGIFPAVCIAAFKMLSLENIVSLCEKAEKKSLSELSSLRRRVHTVTVDYIKNRTVTFDTLRELTEFVFSRQKSGITEETCNKIVSVFDSAVEFRENLKAQRRNDRFSFIGFVLSVIVSLDGISSVLELCDQAFGLFPEADSHKLIIKSTVIVVLCLIILVAGVLPFIKKLFGSKKN